MKLLHFGGSEPGKSGSKKPLKLILGIGALVGVVALGSTLAASINLNAGAPVEFGQGVAQTTACSGNDSIIVTPTSTFLNEEEAGAFYFTSVRLSSIPSSCIGVDFKISAYGNSGNALQLTECNSQGGTSPVIHFTGNSATDHTTDSNMEMYSNVSSKSSSAFTVSWAGGNCTSSALASNVYRITIESSGLATGVPVVSCDSVPNDAPSYYPCGPQNDVAKSTVTNAGWTLCWSGSYGDTVESLNTIQSNCNEDYLIYTGWDNSAPNNLMVLAAAPRTSVFNITDASCFNSSDSGENHSNGVCFGNGNDQWIDNSTLANGTYWYFTPGFSVGFSPTSHIDQYDCDYLDAHNGYNYNGAAGDDSISSNKRLCWHANGPNDSLGSGWMMGGIEGLGNGHTRAIYQYTNS